ncbi:MAG TPA: 2-succinyl-5-enolpyruvyl-6-hydroxy-3-cyclohexene-1-carboxylic-acid synthase [Gordonia sp. (in: high G+C Gram-positive bacteria)]|uniref:2-succinyl-5-enolpyruvyl-6-hydroxy-3- cyclohexene-1-carboxylic-acid synthase n=1 Tax=unclassified Gordonia (in: high G+C Gram-positive bacteria) TaxID=2657482 RepID=UPI000FBA0EC3|nr:MULTISPECIES: 2-succinyl-5-enolpyruvyl-6-hydroxy-3-cyclohexene-1-carboxylic-acid synthase [unclassified Gordonia (in: high G+C Gram-positive bacteria)]RUP39624.1 MAG: 2-succinyl-5-enolpyruvyl-6-hydroxy-3-cyclohexene-1-carboxylic-acid synthase [Gordonia sp. (in: high G+C Gram-positive bacteria)]HNP56886.1 2-succinyl-5-enolpyruvyl-6-hydroxy-3-cyclohexene-1-carboxylic-acid synthase [Gordonia sp. (in: high G+C Gram-positive bacteria)]HRC51959.1 2-succinyl-5-enolpyruvyl-6-hydroxy-3-cyclohexene-1-c
MPINPSTLQGRVIVDEMIRGGVTDAVLCPGSRNAPLAFALHAADAAGRIRLHVRIDERSAGYLALGLAVASRRPVPIVLTSGTAVANVSPAVFEANYARVPLVVVTANRPYELLGSGANQTVEQFGLFSTQVRTAISLGLAEDGLDANSQWRSAVGRVLAAARGARTGNAGPVQFDIPLREPLVPDPDAAVADDLDGFTGRPDGAPWTQAPAGRLDIPVPVDLSLDTVVVAGHGAGVNPELAGLPTVAEPTAPLPANPLHPMALAGLAPQQAIICGRPTLHRGVSRLLADPAVRVCAVTTGPRWPDVSGNVVATGTRVEPVGAPRAQWLEETAQRHRLAVDAVASVLGQTPTTTGLHVAAAVAGAVGADRQLFLGASNPIRDVSLAGMLVPGVRVLSNRGVAGIDGANSTAIGAALAGGPTVALLGDLTFIHDATGLIIGPTEPRPDDLRIVVANDDGGGIFGLLEQGDPRFDGGVYAGAYERIFGTPHRTDIAALCAGVHVAHRRVGVDALPGVLAEPAVGLQVIEVTTDRTGLRGVHAAIATKLV